MGQHEGEGYIAECIEGRVLGKGAWVLAVEGVVGEELEWCSSSGWIGKCAGHDVQAGEVQGGDEEARVLTVRGKGGESLVEEA